MFLALADAATSVDLSAAFSSWRWQELSVVGVVLIVIVSILASVIAKTGITTSIVTIDPATGKKKKIRVNPHLVCKHAADFSCSVSRVAEIVSTIAQMPSSVLALQMKKVEDKWEECSSIFLNNFISALHDKEPDKLPSDNPDFKAYSSLCTDFLPILLNRVRPRFHTNHLSEMSAEERREYIRIQVDNMVAFWSMYLNNRYFGVTIDRAGLFHVNQRIRIDIERTIREGYEYCFFKADEAASQIKKLEKEKNELIGYDLGLRSGGR